MKRVQFVRDRRNIGEEKRLHYVKELMAANLQTMSSMQIDLYHHCGFAPNTRGIF